MAARIVDAARRPAVGRWPGDPRTADLTGSAEEAVTVALRPERIALRLRRVERGGSPGAEMSGTNRLPGTVADVEFLGSIVRGSRTVGTARAR